MLRTLISEARLWLGRRRRFSSAQFWTLHNVTQHHEFATAAESLDYFHWRSDQYLGYLERLPVAGQDGRVVLDFGCGPGHDLVGFGHFSKPRRLIGMDVSPTSLDQAARRLTLHGIHAELIRIDEQNPRLPLEDHSVDYIHSSGVLHHIAEPVGVLRELRRVLRPNGEMRVMVYNEQSVFVQLHVAYLKQIVAQQYPDAPLADAFRRMTDGDACPVSRYYRPEEFCSLAAQAGFAAEHLDNAISAYELSILPERFHALLDRRLSKRHRDFLIALRFDDCGYPLIHGTRAGIDGCYRLKPSAPGQCAVTAKN